MSLFTLNHITLIDKGQHGPWGYALLTPRGSFDADKADVIELRGLARTDLEAIAKALPGIKAESKVLTLEAEVRTEVRDEVFTTKAGEPAAKRVMRVYLCSTPVWNKADGTPDMGNLADILGGDPGGNDPFAAK